LRHCNHQNIIKVTHIQAPSDLLNFNDIYIVFECMDTDLAKLVRDDTQTITIPHVRWFLWQLLLSVKYTHSAGIIHRDVKPANVLLTEACDAKLCDFGLSRSIYTEEEGAGHASSSKAHPTNVHSAAAMQHDEPEEVRDALGVAGRSHAAEAEGAGGEAMDGVDATASSSSTASTAPGGTITPSTELSRVMTRHVVTRWYRSPELPLYNDGQYTTAIDVWSIGCCYAEMLGMLDNGPESRYERKALFPGGSCAPMSREKASSASGKDAKGKEKKDQLAVIMDVLGTPTESEIARVRTPQAQEYLRSLKPKRPEDMSKRFPAATPEALDLLYRFLRFLPEDRITIDEALAHPFLAPVRRPADEAASVRKEGIIPFPKITPENVRELFVNEIRHYNSQIPDNWKELAAAGAYEWRLLLESDFGGEGGAGMEGAGNTMES
jgi:mitogen-activated protein kinase 1/3